jgi:hypothetical protein
VRCKNAENQMVCFQTKNPNLGKFWRVLLWKILVYFMTIWSTLRPKEIFYGHFVYFVVIWCIFPRFDILDQKNLATLVYVIREPFPSPLSFFLSSFSIFMKASNNQ